MCLKIIIFFLLIAAFSNTQGAAIPDQLMEQVEDLLVNPETVATAMGMRVKKITTYDWDKEFDVEDLGLVLKLKYVDPTKPIKGGRAFIKFPARRFVKSATFDEVEMEFDFKGGDAVEGLFEIKIDFKLIQKFILFGDQSHQGTFTLYRKLEDGIYKTNMRLDSEAKELFDIFLETNHVDHFSGKASFGDDSSWEMTFTEVLDKSITINFLHNGVGYSLVSSIDKAALTANVKVTIPGRSFNLNAKLNPAGKYGVEVTGDIYGPLAVLMFLSKNYEEAELNIKHRDTNYALVKLNGEAQISGVIPLTFNYDSTYSFMENYEGQANIQFDGSSPKKAFIVEFFPTGGVEGTVYLILEPTNPGFHYKFEITQGGISYIKQESTQVVTAIDEDKWESTQTTNISMSEESPIYKWHCKNFIQPEPCSTTFGHTQKFFFDKKNKNKFSYESESTHGGKKFENFKVDTTKTPITFMWEVSEAPSYYPFEGKLDLAFTQRENMGFNSIFKFTKNEHIVIQIVQDHHITNDTTKFEMVEDTKVILTEKFYSLNNWYTNLLNTHFRDGHRVRKFFFDKVNKNFLMNKMSFEDKLIRDGKVSHEYKLDTVNTPYVLTINQPAAPQWFPFQGKFDLSLEPKSNFGFHIIYLWFLGDETQLSGDHDVTVINDGNKFQVKEVSKQTIEEQNSYSITP